MTDGSYVFFTIDHLPEATVWQPWRRNDHLDSEAKAAYQSVLHVSWHARRNTGTHTHALTHAHMHTSMHTHTHTHTHIHTHARTHARTLIHTCDCSYDQPFEKVGLASMYKEIC